MNITLRGPFVQLMAKGLFFLLIFASLPSHSADTSFASVCMSPAEWRLYREMNVYRRNLGLPPVKISSALTRVAQQHVIDLSTNNPFHGHCNLHSWSDSGNWSSCCYTDDHRQAECMWDKPMEISAYPGKGYEIVYWSSAGTEDPEFALEALEAWKKSPGHHAVMVNRSRWKNIKWNAIGVGIQGGYAAVWFGTVEDQASEPGKCIP